MSVYTPEIYRRFATPLRLDLGPTASTVEATKTVVDQVKSDTAAVSRVDTRTQAILSQVDAVAARANVLDQRLMDTRVDLGNTRQSLEALLRGTDKKVDDASAALKAAIQVAADDVVQRVAAGLPQAAPTVNDRSAPLVRLLIQAQAIALDETPDERFPKNHKQHPDWLKDDVAILELGLAAAKLDGDLASAPNALRDRFRRAFEKFSSNSLPERAKRFADMHALVGEVAAFLK